MDEDNYEDLFQIGQNTIMDNKQVKESIPMEGGIELKEIIALVRRRFLIIIVATIFSALTSVYIALTTPEVFKADLMMVTQAKEDPSGGGIASLARNYGSIAKLTGIVLPGSPQKGTAIAIMESRKFTEHFFNTYNLLPYLFADSWNKDKNEWKGSPPKKSDIYRRMTDMTTIYEDRATGILTLSVFDGDANKAANIANNMVSFLNQTIRESAIKESKTKIEFLNKELAQATMSDARQMLFGLIGQETRSIMLANTKTDYVFKIIDPATPPEIRVQPKRTTMVITGTTIGGFLSLIIAFFYDKRKQIIDTLKSLES